MRSRCSPSLALALAVVTVILFGGRVAPDARGDADPASDLLVGTAVYYPYTPPVARSLQATLSRELSQLRRQGLNLKIALIATKVDLGAIPELFGKPQTYADFLDRELAFNGPQPLLVVMPDGFGVAHAGPAAALDGLRVDPRHGANGLARSAALAVLRIAHATGKTVSALALPTSTGKVAGGRPAVVAGVAGAVAFVLVMTALWLRRRGVRRRHADPPPGLSSDSSSDPRRAAEPPGPRRPAAPPGPYTGPHK